jgi:hypothetical protein
MHRDDPSAKYQKANEPTISLSSLKASVSITERQRYGLEEGPLIIAEDREEGILIRPLWPYPWKATP